MLLAKLKIATAALGVVAVLTGGALPTSSAKPADKSEAAKDDKELLQGTWTVARTEIGGKHHAEEDSTEQIWSFDGDKLRIRYKDGSLREADFHLDPSKKPKEIDLTFSKDPFRETEAKGIYQLDGDDLKVSYYRGEKRPAEFKDKGEDRGRRYFVLKRSKAK